MQPFLPPKKLMCSTSIYLLMISCTSYLWSCRSSRTSAPLDVCLINSTIVNTGTIHFIRRGDSWIEWVVPNECIRDIFNASRPLSHLQGLKRNNDPCARAWDEEVCTVGLNLDSAITTSVQGGLFDVRLPDNVDNGTLQAIFYIPPVGCEHGLGNYEEKIRKIEITLFPGLQVGVPTSQGTVRVVSSPFPGRDREYSPTTLFQFTLERVDTAVSPARCRGTFKCIVRIEESPATTLYIEGEFLLRDFRYNPLFLPQD